MIQSYSDTNQFATSIKAGRQNNETEQRSHKYANKSMSTLFLTKETKYTLVKRLLMLQILAKPGICLQKNEIRFISFTLLKIQFEIEQRLLFKRSLDKNFQTKTHSSRHWKELTGTVRAHDLVPSVKRWDYIKSMENLNFIYLMTKCAETYKCLATI